MPEPKSLIHPRQAALAAVFAGSAVVLLLTFSCYLFLPHKEEESLGASLLSQALTCALLIMPMIHDCRAGCIQQVAIYMCRAAGVAFSLTGLSLVLVSLAVGHETASLAVGALLLTLAGLSLMTTFWPSYIEEPLHSNNNNNNNNSRGEERAPFLSSSNGQAPEEGAYHLMQDTNEHHQNNNSSDEERSPFLSPSNGQAPDEEGGYHSNEDHQNANGTDTITTTTPSIRGTRRLLQLATPQVYYLYAGCVVLLIRLPFSLSIPHFVSTTLSAVAAGDWQRARHEIVLLFILGCVDAALDFWCVFLFGYANQRIVRGLRLDLFKSMIRQDVAFFDQTTSGELASRLNSDCGEMAADLTWVCRMSIESIVRLAGIAGYMMIRSPTLAACALSIVPVVGVINKLYGDWLRRNATQVQDALAAANAVAQEALSNVRTVIAFTAERYECYRYKDKIQKQYKLSIRQLFMTGVYYMVVSTFLINTVVQAVLLWIGTNLIQQGKLTAEVLLAFMLYQGQLQHETFNIFLAYTSLIKSTGAGEKVFGLLDREPPAPSVNSPNVRIDEEETSAVEEDQQQYDVQLSGVTFSYPTRPQHLVLDEVDLSIPKGKTVALVGASGCGKTTIVNLLQRFYDPTAGRILIDGVDLKELDLWRHRKQTGIVTQDPALFSGTLLENITYGIHSDTPPSMDQVVRAAEMANIHAFIQGLPDGYNTAVGERGVQLSGGQKQRISIARAIIKSPALLLLDEATSALDTASEQAVQEALDRLLKEKHDMTTVIIAHRLRTVRNADVICVLHQGRVVEQGTHDELLLHPDSMYRKMVERASPNGILPEK